MSQEWYYSVDGDRQGPVSAADLKKLADAGTLKAVDLVWKDGMADWVQAKSIKGLFADSAAPTASKSGEQAAAKASPATDDEDERPSRSRPRDEEDKRLSRGRGRNDDEDDERPARARGRDDDEDDDRPVRRQDDDEVDEDDRPRKKKKRRIPDDVGSKKLTAGLLGILIGWTGAHRFYLGDTGGGIIRICLNLVCAGGIIGLIEGIIYLTKTDEDFYRDYIVEQKAWF